MSLVFPVLLLLAVCDSDSLDQTGRPWNDSVTYSSLPQQDHDSTITQAALNGFFVTEDVSLNDTETVTENPNNNTGSRSGNHSIEADKERVQVAGYTFELCAKENLCREICKGSEPVEVGSFSLSPGGTGDVNRPLLQRKRRDMETSRAGRDADGLNDASGTSAMDMPAGKSGREVSVVKTRKDTSAVRMRFEREAEEYDEEVTETGNDQSNAEDKCSGQTAVCSCDKYCIIFGDCCVDVFEYWYGQNDSLTELFSLISDVKIRTSIQGNFTNLVQMLELNPRQEQNVFNDFLMRFASCERVNATISIFVISRCPEENVDKSLKEKCEELNSPLIPHILATLTEGSVVFKNIFCAQCHGIDSSFLKMWPSKIKCDEDSKVAMQKALTVEGVLKLYEAGTCRIIYTDLETYPSRFCTNGTKFVNNNTSAHIRDMQCSELDSLLCKAYYLPYKEYKNPHCRKCFTGEAATETICNDGDKYTFPENPGILVILDISGRFSQDSTGIQSYFCMDDEVFDPFTADCKTLRCALGQKPFRGVCVDTADVFVPSSSQLFTGSFRSLHFRSTIRFPANKAACAEAYLLFSVFLFKINIVVNSQAGQTGLPEAYNIFNIEKCENYVNQTEVIVRFEIDVAMKLQKELSQQSLSNLTDKVTEFFQGNITSYTNHLIITNMVNGTEKEYGCPYGYNLTMVKDFTLADNNNEIFVLINSGKQKFHYPLNNIGFDMMFTKPLGSEEPIIVDETAYVCEENRLFANTKCSVVSYWLNQTSQNGTTLKILSSNQIYEKGKFVIRGNEVIVCSDFISAFQTDKIPLVNSVFSLVVTLVSITFLSVMLALYCMFPELLSLPGKLTASMAATLMMTFIFSLVPLTSLKQEVVCAVLAAVNHLVTLAYFWWMSSIAFNMAWTFGPNSLVKAVSDKEAFRGFSIFVWGLSLAIVLPSVILDIVHRRESISSVDTAQPSTAQEEASLNLESPPTTDESSRFPVYGKANCVWFLAPLWARLTFILIPYLISFITTVIGFALTLIGLQKSRKISEKLGKGSSERTLCLIYIKLSTAMGFSWILSIVVDVYPHILALQYIYVGLTLLQGMLLFLAFMANKRVYTLIRQRMQPTMSRSSQKTFSSSTNTTYTRTN